MTTRTPEYTEEGHVSVWPKGEPQDLREKFNQVLAEQAKTRVSYPVERTR